MFMSRCFYEFLILKFNDRGIFSVVRVIGYVSENVFKMLKEGECLIKYMSFFILFFFVIIYFFIFY